MNKKALSLVLLWILMLAGMFLPVFAEEVSIPDADHYIIESIGDPQTVDPAWSYDTASGGLIFHVYETLIKFDRERNDVILPMLATSYYEGPPARPYMGPGTDWPVVKTWYFEMRTGVQFHSGNTMTPEDAEYSIEHIMVQDRSGGPEWMIFESLLGVYHNHGLGAVKNPDGTPGPDAAAVGHIMDDAVESNSTHVWLNFAHDYPTVGFQQIFCQTWASVLDKDFFIANGDWPGFDVTNGYTDWVYYDDPPTPPIDEAGNLMSGTGPFALDYWLHGVEWSIVKFDDYWGGWPAPSSSGYLNRLTEKVVYEWSTRLADFKAGAADSVYVPRAYIAAVEGHPGIRGLKDVPSLTCGGMFFNYEMTMPSPYVGTGSFPDGIPANFLGDERIRKAFAYAFEYDRFLHEIFLDEAEQPPSPHIGGLAFAEYVWSGATLPNGTYLPAITKYVFDSAQVASLFQAASADPTSPAKDVWTKGFKMTITYNAGNIPRMTAASMLETNIEAAFADNGGGPVDISTLAVTWSTYLDELWWYPTFRSIMPIYIIGWLADYPDPHNFCMPFQHSEGDFAYPSSYHNPAVDAMIEDAAMMAWEAYPGLPADPTLDIYNKRPAMYHAIAQSYYDDCPSVALYQPTARRFEREWVQGWYYNSIYPMTYYYPVWKGVNAAIDYPETPDEVDIYDAGVLSGHWYDPPAPPGPLGYDVIADMLPSLQYTLKNLGTHVGDGVGPLASIGHNDIYDAGYLNWRFGDIIKT